MDADGSNPKILTDTGRNYGPAVSPDGRYIAFHSNRSGNFQIWIANRDGSSPRQLTNRAQECHWPQFSADGKWIIYESFDGESPVSLWMTSVEGGQGERLTASHAIRGTVSPDGKWIACWLGDSADSKRRWQLAIIPASGGLPSQTFDVASSVPISWEAPLSWTADGRNITYADVRGGVANLWNQSIDGGPPKQVTDFKDSRIYSFDWSHDGRLMLSRGVTTNDVVLMSEVR